MKKRLITLMLALSLAFALAIPAGAAVVDAMVPTDVPEPTVVTDKPELYLDYMEFYNNQEYYKNLVLTEDYRLFINVGEEYADMEYARIMDGADEVDTLTSNVLTRGTSIPDDEWNINTKGTYHFTVDTDAPTIYTKYYFTGANAYLLTVFNPYNSSGGATIYGAIGSPLKVNAFFGTVIQKYSSLMGSRFYVGFHKPAHISGSIEKAS